MFGLIVFVFIISGAGALLLFFNKGENAQKIKSVLSKILDNLRDLFKNLQELFSLIKGIVIEETSESNESQETSESMRLRPLLLKRQW